VLPLATAHADRGVMTYDPVLRIERERYLALVSPSVRARVRFVNEPGSTGPRDGMEVDLLNLDSAHERQVALDELGAWRPALRPGALVVLDDFTHPEFPGVREAVRELGVTGGAAWNSVCEWRLRSPFLRCPFAEVGTSHRGSLAHVSVNVGARCGADRGSLCGVGLGA